MAIIMISKNKFRKIIYVTISIGALATFSGLGWIGQSFFGKCWTWIWPQQELTIRDWQSTRPEERYVFVRRILSGGKFFGYGLSRLESALGPPDYVSDIHVDYVIRTFPDGGCGLNSIAILRMHLDPNGKVDDILIAYD